MEKLTAAGTVGNHDDAEYDAFLARIGARFQALTANGTPVFTTDAEDLYGAYLAGFEGEQRQYHTCHACRQFIERFGSLAVIGEDGSTAPAVWLADDAPELYRPSIAAMERLVRRAKVTGPFLATEKVWGQPVTGQWRHFHVKAPSVFPRGILTAGQKMAELREDFKNVMYALNEFTQPMIEQALVLLETDALYRAEKVIGPARWLQGLHVARAKAQGAGKANVVWRAIATAPAGFAHPRSSMIGTLLEDIAAGKDYAEVSRAFKAKMHPLQYQRPQAAPAAGNIAQAEKVIAQLGLAPSLERRIARLDEVPKLWEPREQQPPQPVGGGVFGHLTPKGAQAPLQPMAGVPPVVMTLEKFVRTVVPSAEAMELQVSNARQAFIAITTAVNADAPPILQWDREDARNPFAWYVWNGGSAPSQFGLAPGWVKVAAIIRLPARWNDSQASHQGDGVILLLEGARETRQVGNALFPECLRADLHAVRSTIEAFSRGAQMQGLEDGSAIGYDLRDKRGGYPVTVRVKASGRTVDYKLDRWD